MPSPSSPTSLSGASARKRCNCHSGETIKKAKPTASGPPTSASAGKRASIKMGVGDDIPDAKDIPCVLGGASKNLMIPRPVLRRAAFLQNTTPEALIETLKILHGVSVTICDWPTGEAFFLVAGSNRNFSNDKRASCCNCQTELLISGDAPDNAVPICAQCVRFQAVLANTHGVTVH